MLPVAMLSIALFAGVPGGGNSVRTRDMDVLVRAYIASHTEATTRFLLVHANIPSFARQTGLACSACHTSFPQLNAFGRLFKLNGYTLTNSQLIQAGDSGKRETLKLNLIPPVSAMVQTSLSQTKRAPDGTQNGNVEFPQQLSLFVGGEITPKIGTFLQLTYSGNDGVIGIDNAEIRYASRTQLASKELIYGLTLNNNPTMQDVWNTVPAWRFPFASSEVAPTPLAAPLLDGALAQQVAGLGGYAMYNGLFYAEYGAYRSAAQGGPHPPDSSATNTISGAASYWRAFIQHASGDNTVMVGTYGIAANLFPAGVIGAVNRYSDFAVDAQFESKLGGTNINAHGSWVRESQHLDATFAADGSANPTNTLKELRLDAGLVTASRLGVTLGYFNITGTTDPLLYGAAPVQGSATGSPNSAGAIGELSIMPWLNTRFALQYVAYNKFNGAKLNYDGFGRNASDNNVLYLLAWLAF